MSEHKECHVEPLQKPLDTTALSTARAAYLNVWGMGCPRCAMRVRNGLLGLEHVLYADVFLEDSLAIAAYDPEYITIDDLVRAVAAAGNDGRHNYQATVLGQVPASEALQW